MDKPSIFEALNAVAVEVGAVRKGDRNQQQGFNFRGVDAVVNAVAPALRRAGVVVVPEVLDVEYATVEVGQRRTPMGHCRVRVRYTWYGPGGDSVASTVVAEAMDSGDKSSPKAMSVAYRTAILQTLALPTDDPEPDAQTYQRSRRQADREAPPRRAQQGMGTDRGSCPYYMTRGLPDAQRGECSFGCRDEPVCITSEPEGGWPAAYDANDPAKIKRRMFALFRDAGVGTAREDRIQFCRIATGRDSINSSDDLTAAEVAMVIKALEAGIAEPKEAAS